MSLKDYIEAALTVVFIGIGGMAMGWFKILKETNALLKEQNEELKTDNKQWQQKHIENERAIAKLQGQVDTLQNIPLVEISAHMRDQTKFMKEVFKFMQQTIKE